LHSIGAQATKTLLLVRLQHRALGFSPTGIVAVTWFEFGSMTETVPEP
jgi:hypothetical protein